MKKLFLIVAAFFLFCTEAFTQGKRHKIVFDFSKGDTASFATMMRELNNILLVAPDSELEVVSYGPGIFMLVKDSSTVRMEIEQLSSKYKVRFLVCANTMSRRNIDKQKLIPQAVIVPVALLEISSREKEGWSYIKAGH